MMQTLWDSFGLAGLAWLLASAAGALCLLGYLLVPALRSANVARVFLALALVGLIAGGIRTDRVDEIVLADAEEKKPEEIDPAKAAELKARASKVRFAEDSNLDTLDIAGASKSELNPDKAESTEPKYAYQKKGVQTREGQTIARSVEGEESAASQPAPRPVLKLPERQYSMVRRLDHMALSLTRALLWAGVILLLGDYVMRTRRMFAASLPVGIAAKLARTIRPGITHAWVNRAALDGHPLGVLAAIRSVQKDGTCLYVGAGEPWSGRSIPRLVIPSTYKRMPSLTYTGKPGTYDADFALESMWHGKACVAVVGRENGEKLLKRLLDLIVHKELLVYSGKTLVQVVWDLEEPPEQGLLDALMAGADKAGLAVLVVSDAPVPAHLARRFGEVYEEMPEWDLSATAGERALMWVDEKVFARG